MTKTTPEPNIGRETYQAVIPGSENSVSGTRAQGSGGGGFSGAATDTQAARNLTDRAQQMQAAQVNIAQMNTAAQAEQALQAEKDRTEALVSGRSPGSNGGSGGDSGSGAATPTRAPAAEPVQATEPFGRPGDRFGDAALREARMRRDAENPRARRSVRDAAAQMYLAELNSATTPKDAAALNSAERRTGLESEARTREAQAQAFAQARGHEAQARGHEAQAQALLQNRLLQEQGDNERARLAAATQLQGKAMEAERLQATDAANRQQHWADKRVELDQDAQKALDEAFTPTKEYTPVGSKEDFLAFIPQMGSDLQKRGWSADDAKRLAMGQFRDRNEFNLLHGMYEDNVKARYGKFLGTFLTSPTATDTINKRYPLVEPPQK